DYYRILADARYDAELNTFSGRTIDVPSCFIGGASDWGVRQSPGALEAMPRGTGRNRMNDEIKILAAVARIDDSQAMAAFLAAIPDSEELAALLARQEPLN